MTVTDSIIQWTPAFADSGVKTVSVRVSDAKGGYDTLTWTITVKQNIVPLDSGVIAYYRCNEGSGTVLHDVTGNGHNGTIYNATWGAGVDSGSLNFDGSSSYVLVPSSPAFNSLHGITMEAWVKPRTYGVDPVNAMIFCRSGSVVWKMILGRCN